MAVKFHLTLWKKTLVDALVIAARSLAALPVIHCSSKRAIPAHPAVPVAHILVLLCDT